jgi:flavoprotein
MTKKIKGYHPVYCFMCGKKFGTVIHYGGKKRLKKCACCREVPHYCFDCFYDKEE